MPLTLALKTRDYWKFVLLYYEYMRLKFCNGFSVKLRLINATL